MSLADALIARALPLVPRPVVGRVASRYIAGETVDDAVRTVRQLNAAGMRATIDALGEDIHNRAESEAVLREYRRLLAVIEEQGLDANVSVKLTALGLELSEDFCREQLVTLLDDAAARGLFVRIDMEDSSTTDRTLDLYESLRDNGRDNVGVVLQAMLRRTLADAERLGRRQAAVRVCKGIYREPRRLAYEDPEIVRRNFMATVETLLDAGSRVAIATHDELLLWEARRLVDRRGLGPERYELQMLLGVQEELRSLLLAEGRPLRVYVPYGHRWYEYSVRRLEENPKVAGYVARALAERALGRRE